MADAKGARGGCLTFDAHSAAYMRSRDAARSAAFFFAIFAKILIEP